MTREQIITLHGLIDRDNPATYLDAANYFIDQSGVKGTARPSTPEQAILLLQALRQGLLDSDLYTEAALLCWGTRLFNPNPRSVRMIWRAVKRFAKIIIMGAGSMGKSYSAVAFVMLDWSRDPKYTSVKLVSTTAGHAKANTFSTLIRFHEESAIPMPGEVQAGFIGLSADDRHSAITIVAIPTGAEGKARLTGFHPLPRTAPHPIFGNMSRNILLVDEAEDAPVGIWEGIGNMLGNEDEIGSVKVIVAYNPKKKEAPCGQRAEPEGGWDSVDIDTSESWSSAMGWEVLRLDGKRCENVEQKAPIYEGLLTWQGYQNHARGGVESPDYFTMARGWYPEQNVAFNVVPPYVPNEIRGVYTFERVVSNLASFDPAFAIEGDNPILTTGRYGLAIGYQRFGVDPLTRQNYAYEDFRNAPRYAIQIEQQFPIKKGKTLAMAADLMKILRSLRIRPEWFITDRTGNGLGLYDVLSEQFGEIYGVEWGEAASEKKILEEDSLTAYERYDGVSTEMYFALALWAEYGFIAIQPIVSTSPLFTQLIGRKYKGSGKVKRKLESKADFKLRNGGRSPDEADSLVMMVHLVRMRHQTNAAALTENRVASIEAQSDWDALRKRQEPVASHRVQFLTVK